MFIIKAHSAHEFVDEIAMIMASGNLVAFEDDDGNKVDPETLPKAVKHAIGKAIDAFETASPGEEEVSRRRAILNRIDSVLGYDPANPTKCPCCGEVAQ